MEKEYCTPMDAMLPHIASSEKFYKEKGAIIEHFSYHLYLDDVLFRGELIATKEYSGTSGGRNSTTWNHFEEIVGRYNSVHDFYKACVFPARKAQAERDSKEEE